MFRIRRIRRSSARIVPPGYSHRSCTTRRVWLFSLANTSAEAQGAAAQSALFIGIKKAMLNVTYIPGAYVNSRLYSTLYSTGRHLSRIVSATPLIFEYRVLFLQPVCRDPLLFLLHFHSPGLRRADSRAGRPLPVLWLTRIHLGLE